MSDPRLPVTVKSGFLGDSHPASFPVVENPARQGRFPGGASIDWPALKAKLDACLVPEGVATGPDTLPLDLPDPFPGWRRAEAAA